MNGVIIVNKPKTWTSHDVINKIKRLLKAKKIGHAGTLDPDATGVLVVLLNGATKLSDYLIADEKEYIFDVVIGAATDTEDASGVVLSEKNVDELGDVDQVLAGLVGKMKQVPPMYSSVHHQGRKLYEYAREGQVVEREARAVEVYAIERISEIIYENGRAKFSAKARVSKGTYIRTLAVEIGNRLNFPAHMGDLCRIASGIFKIDAAVTINDIEAGDFKIIPMVDALPQYKHINLNKTQFDRVMLGKTLLLDCRDQLVVLSYNNEMVAIYERDGFEYRAKRVWK